MEAHAHEHCQHEHLKFCRDCRVVHCLDCKQEWSTAPCTAPHFPAYCTLPHYPAIAPIWSGPTWVGGSVPAIVPADITPTIVCDHMPGCNPGCLHALLS